MFEPNAFLENLYFLSQVGTTVIILVSVVLLFRQLRQATNNQLAQMHESRALWVRNDVQRMSDPALLSVLRKGGKADEALDENEIEQFALFGTSIFQSWEEQFRQKRDQMLDGARWASTEANMRLFLASPGWRAVARTFMLFCDKGFAGELQRLIEEARAASPPASLAQVWKSFAIEERESAQATASDTSHERLRLGS